MKIHKEGYGIISKYFIIIAFIIIIINYLVKEPYSFIAYIIDFALLVLLFLIIFFFRVDRRDVVDNNNQIRSSADGKVVAIEEVFEKEYFNEKRIQVSVFMSPLNMHLNYYPVNGKVIYSKYKKGKHLVAFNPKSSLENEMHTTIIETDNSAKILVRQIAGAVAFRIVCYAEENIQCIQGQELGFIKFGSRVDFLLPKDVKINVKLNQIVRGSETIIAYFKL